MNPHVFPPSSHLFNRERGPVIFPALAEEAVSCLLLKFLKFDAIQGEMMNSRLCFGLRLPTKGSENCVQSVN